MRASRFMCALIVLCGLFTGPTAASAQTPDRSKTLDQEPLNVQALRQEIDQLKKDFDARLAALEARLAAIGGAQAGATPPPSAPQAQPTAEVPPGAAGAGGPSGALPVYGGASAASKIFNPDMAVIGDFLGAAGSNKVAPGPALEMHEAEASFQAIVDPYARADFFVAFGEEGVELEEGFVTFPTLPGGLLMKAGKMRAAFGKVNPLHNHRLSWTDRPLVTNNLVGGEEGMGDAGISIARLVPNPWIFLEATGEVFRGDSGDIFSSSERGDLSYVGRLRGYHDIAESTNVDLGFSYSRGHNASGVVSDRDLGRFTTNLFGVDGTVRWRPLQRSIYRSFIGRSEIIWSRRDQPGGLQTSSGIYLSGDYQVARRWFTGVRLDWSARADDASLVDTGQSLVLTYWPSEFGQVRGQYRRTKYAIGPTANEFLFQFVFAIGAHGAHSF